LYKCSETLFNQDFYLFSTRSGILAILSYRSKPLQIWDKSIKNGHLKRIMDGDMQSSVIEIVGANVSNNYISCPSDPNQTLGIKMPYLVLLIKYVRRVL
jgi:hypothetical protein